MGGTYRDLKAWQSAMDLVREAYRCTRQFPAQEDFGLTNQIRRAAVSIASNIAEGKGRSSDRELAQFLTHARGSLFEVETQFSIAQALKYLPETEVKDLFNRTAEVGRLLNGLLKSIRKPET